MSLNERGFPATDIGIASDDRENLVKMIGKGLAEHDVIVTSGGVSMGEKVSLLQRHAWESSVGTASLMSLIVPLNC